MNNKPTFSGLSVDDFGDLVSTYGESHTKSNMLQNRIGNAHCSMDKEEFQRKEKNHEEKATWVFLHFA